MLRRVPVNIFSARNFHPNYGTDHPQSPKQGTPISSSTSSTSTITPPHHAASTSSYHFMRNDLERVIRGATSQSLRFWLFLSGILGSLAFFFWDTIIQFWSKQGADVANRSLSDEELLKNATDSLKRVTTNALQAPETVEKLVSLLKSLLEQPEARVILITFLLQVLKDPATQVMAKDFFSIVLRGMLDDPNTQQIAVQFLKTLLADASFQASAVELVKTVVKNQTTRDSFIELLKYVMTDELLLRNYAVPFVKRLLAHPYVRDQVGSVGGMAVHDILDNPNIRDHAVVFVRGILDDQALQQQGSNALWEIIKSTFTPSWFSSTGRPIVGAADDPSFSQLSHELKPQMLPQPVEGDKNSNNSPRSTQKV